MEDVGGLGVSVDERYDGEIQGRYRGDILEIKGRYRGDTGEI